MDYLKSFKVWCETNSERGRRLLEEWDEEKNLEVYGRGINEFKPYSSYNAFWRCSECGEIYRQPIKNRTSGHNHPACSNESRKMKAISKVKREDSVLVKRPDLAADLDEKKNLELLGLSSDKLTEFSSRKVYWKCHSCGYEWQASMKNMAMREIACKACRKTARERKGE